MIETSIYSPVVRRRTRVDKTLHISITDSLLRYRIQLGLLRRWGLVALALAVILIGANGCNVQVPESKVQVSGPQREIPHSVIAEHEALNRQLQDAIRSGGQTGETAKLVAERLNPHFAKEEEFALPPLAALGSLDKEGAGNQMSDVIKLSEKLSAELPQMLNEHKAITLALDQLVDAAKNENKTAAIEFAEKLREHARMEEEILYPTAILVGRYLRLRSNAGTATNR